MLATELPRRSAKDLAELGFPYINAFQVSPLDVGKFYGHLVPGGYDIRATLPLGDWKHSVPDGAIRIGQGRVRTGDPTYIIYAAPTA